MKWHNARSGRNPLVHWTSAVMAAAVLFLISGVAGWSQPTLPLPSRDEVANQAGEVIVHLDDGREFRGVLVERNTQRVIIKISGIATTFDANDVRDVTAIKSFDEYYEGLKAIIPNDRYELRFQLCEWIYTRDQLHLAALELKSLLADNPSYGDAKALLKRVNARLALEQEQILKPKDNRPPATTPNDVGRRSQLGPSRLLTDDQVSLLKVYEIDVNNPPRIIIPRKTIDRLIDEYADQTNLIPNTPSNQKLLYRKDPVEILKIMFQVQARHLYSEVRVLSEPEAFNRFRLGVHRTWLINSCATSRCHGGDEAGQLFLFNRRSHDDNTVFTNFLILDRTSFDGEPMLNYEHPERSLLLQMGLPPRRAARAHPRVENWRAIFTDEEDPRFTRTVEWLGSMYRPHPEYPIEYELPSIEAPKKAPESPDEGVDEAQEPRPTQYLSPDER